jgi:hypothetical protein
MRGAPIDVPGAANGWFQRRFGLAAGFDAGARGG